jgi:hypothetical protein
METIIGYRIDVPGLDKAIAQCAPDDKHQRLVQIL